MKTLKSMLGSIVLLVICATASAAVKPAASRITKDDVINMYIDAIAHGDIKGLDNILDDSLQYDIKRGNEVRSLHKYQLLDYLNSNPLDPSVTTTSSVVREGDSSTVIKVDFKYSGYTRTDMVTLYNEGGWMITKVVSTYS